MPVTRGRGSLGDLTSAQAGEAAGRLVLVPVGAVEQHGPHLPLRTDIGIAGEVAAHAARAAGALLADPLPFGCSAHHRSFPGTVSLGVGTFQSVVVDVAVSLAQDGFVPVFVNGHGGNRAPLGAALQMLLERGVTAWAVTYFELIAAEAEARFGHEAMGHACALETSIAMHLWPQLVHAEAFPAPQGRGVYPDPFLYSAEPVVLHRRFEEFGPSGIVGDPAGANSEAGREMFDCAVERLVTRLDRISAATRAEQRGNDR